MCRFPARDDQCDQRLTHCVERSRFITCHRGETHRGHVHARSAPLSLGVGT